MIFDGHIDIFTDVTIKRLNGEKNILDRYHLDRFKKGEVTAGTFVLWIDPPFTDNPSARLAQVLQATKDELAECSNARLVKNFAELEQAKKDKVFAIFLGMEGLSGIDNNVEKLHELIDFGVTQVMLTWNEENTFATGANADPNHGLKDLGKKAIDIIQEKKLILDVSHLNERSFWDVIDYAQTPILASHSNAYSLVPAKRNLTDDQLRAIRDTNGIVGLNSFRPFVAVNNDEQNLKGLLKQLVYLVDKLGVDKVAFGFDFIEFLQQDSVNSFVELEVSWVDGLEDATKISDFIKEMKNHGFSDSEIKGIAYENLANFIKRVRS